MANPGDRVRIFYDKKEIEGILMPSESENSVFVKLDSGYNIGIEKGKVKEIKVVEAKKEKKEVN